jgi:S-adenosylmethionine synthetase
MPGNFTVMLTVCNYHLTGLGAVCSVGCEHPDKYCERVPCLIQYPSSSLSCSAVTKLILVISADIDTSQHMRSESRVRMLITVIFPYRTGGRAVSLAGIVPKL